MYEYIYGKLVEATPQMTVIDVGGIGYKISIPLNHFQKMPEPGVQVFLYTHLVIRENDHTLYGFLTKHERELFLRFIDVSGIGPKTALSLLGHSDPINIVSSIRESNVSALCKVPGIGKKTAERLILEVKDKLPHDLCGTTANRVTMDALNALMNLGYSQNSADKAIKTALKNEEIEDLGLLITSALKHCS